MADTIMAVGAFLAKMNIRKAPSVTAEKIGGTYIGDVMEVTGESSGALAEKFLCGNIYHDNDPVIHGWVKKYYDIDGETVPEEVLTELNIPGVNVTVNPTVSFEDALKIVRDVILKIP